MINVIFNKFLVDSLGDLIDKFKEIDHKYTYGLKTGLSNEEYDFWRDYLYNIIGDHEYFDQVGTEFLTKDSIFKHAPPMLSIEKVKDQNKVNKWIENKGDVVKVAKLDGIACSLVYKDGELVIAKSRGNGVYGESIYNNLLYVCNIPYKLEVTEKGILEVRGEICIKKGLVDNDRNVVAGLMKRINKSDKFSYELHFIAWELINSKNEFYKEDLLTLSKLGFEVVSEVEDIKDIDHLSFSSDGMVIRVNDNKLFKELGCTKHHPRGLIAYKCNLRGVRTVVEGIEYKMSRYGKLTPVGLIADVFIKGAKISRVNFHNYNFMMINKISIGAEIEIVRSGDIIPTFNKLIKEGIKEITPLVNCPFCNSKVKDEVCNNNNCKELQIQKILHDHKHIKGFSRKKAEQLMYKGNNDR